MKRDWAMIAAQNIWEDCLDRAGIKHEFRNVEPHVKNKEVLPAWANLIRGAHKASLGPTQAPVHQEQAQFSGNSSEPETNSTSEVSRCEIS